MTVKIIHKNSSVEFKNATSDQLEYGELALNYNESGPYLQCKGSDDEIVQLGGVFIGDTAPGNPIPGKWWLYGTTLNVFDGTEWVAIAGADDCGSGGPSENVYDGRLTIEDEDGNTLGTFTANQQSNTTITIPTSDFSGSWNDLTDKPTIGDGTITIEESDGNDVGEFTVNQVGDLTITLPPIFSGDYDDLINKPDIGNGKITIFDTNGDDVGEFTVNQSGDTEITLPASADQIHIGDTYPGTPSLGDLWVNTSECPPVLYIWNDCDGVEEWKPIGGGGVGAIDFVARIEDDGTALGNTPGRVLTALADNITGGTTPVEHSYRWLRAGVVFIGSNKTHTLTTDDIGTTISCEVTVAEPDGTNDVARTAVYSKIIEISGTIDTPSVLAPYDGAGSGNTRLLISDVIINVDRTSQTVETDTINSVDSISAAPNVILGFPSANNFNYFAVGDVIQQPDVKIIEINEGSKTITVSGGKWETPAIFGNFTPFLSTTPNGNWNSLYPPENMFDCATETKVFAVKNETAVFAPDVPIDITGEVALDISVYANEGYFKLTLDGVEADLLPPAFDAIHNNTYLATNAFVGKTISQSTPLHMELWLINPKPDGEISNFSSSGMMVNGSVLVDSGNGCEQFYGEQKLVKVLLGNSTLTLASNKDLADMAGATFMSDGAGAPGPYTQTPYKLVTTDIASIDDSNPDEIKLTFPGDVSTNPDLRYFAAGDVVQDPDVRVISTGYPNSNEMVVDGGTWSDGDTVEYQTNGGEGTIISINTDDNTIMLSNTGDRDNRWIGINKNAIDFFVAGPQLVDDPLLTADVELLSSNFATTPPAADTLKNIVWELNGVEQDAGTSNPYKPSGLAINTTYTVRVKHQGNRLNDSSWSTSTTFSTGAVRNLHEYYQDLIAGLVNRIEILEGN